MRWIIRLLVLIVAVVAAYFSLWPTGVDPISYDLPEAPALEGVYADNNALDAARLVQIVGRRGPEDLAFGPDGLIYTGLEDGMIVRIDLEAEGGPYIKEFANTGGRPLGVQFDASGNLIVADAYQGLVSINASGELTILSDEYEGDKLLFVDDLDIAADGKIWFSDMSTKYDLHNNITELFDGLPRGRLFTYDPATGLTELVLSDLAMANGVALGPNEDYVLINETMYFRITRLWLKGERAGEREIFIDNLPGYPDNLSFNGKDHFWVALVSPRQPDIDALSTKPFVRQVMLRLAILMGAPPAGTLPVGGVISLDGEGNVVASLRAPTGHHSEITSVHEVGGKLYMGSLARSNVAILELESPE